MFSQTRVVWIKMHVCYIRASDTLNAANSCVGLIIEILVLMGGNREVIIDLRVTIATDSDNMEFLR